MAYIVIALGGNALLRKGQKPSCSVQMNNIRKTARSMAWALSKLNMPFVLTHGNGPQVGDEFLRNLYAKEVPATPLYLLNAETQAYIGSMLQLALEEQFRLLGKALKICTIITHTVVSKGDLAFKKSTKPIGPFYTKAQLDAELKREHFQFVRVRGMYRRVVPSPKPTSILEAAQTKALLDAGYSVICCGGGGVPICKEKSGFSGANAVIDKDRTTAMLADLLKAKRMIILTDVDSVRDQMGRRAKSMSASEIKRSLNYFEEGTMRPKLESCMLFVSKAGRQASIGNLYKLDKILKGKSGTVIRR